MTLNLLIIIPIITLFIVMSTIALEFYVDICIDTAIVNALVKLLHANAS